MQPNLQDTIATLDDWQTFVCCRVLVLLMDRRMAGNPRSGRPTDLAVMDFHRWIQIGGNGIRSLVAALCHRDLTATAAIGRRLMQACRRLGYTCEVRSACQLVNMPTDYVGTLSPITVVAALAAVLQWHPGRPSLKKLLRASAPPTGSKRRYPWFEPPPKAPAERIPAKQT